MVELELLQPPGTRDVECRVPSSLRRALRTRILSKIKLHRIRGLADSVALVKGASDIVLLTELAKNSAILVIKREVEDLSVALYP